MNIWRYRLSVRLALVCAVCAIALGAHAAAPDAPIAAGAAQPGNPLWAIPLSTLTATPERPLFTPSRRPPMQAAPAVIVNVPPPPPPPAEPEQLGLRLLGTIAGREGGIAICLNVATSEVVRVRTGESFEGWNLRTVRGREATFEKASRQEVLALPAPDDPRQPNEPRQPIAMPAQIAGARALPLRPPQPLPLSVSPVNAVPAQRAPVSGTWRDGDGNLIAAPKR
jgi:general secretion pathway protein N